MAASTGDRSPPPSRPWEHLIDLDRIRRLHARAIRRYGGDPTVAPRAETCVQQALGNAWNASLYQEATEAVPGLGFAAHLLYYLARDHCFTDGNKRIAWLAAIEVLKAERLTLTGDQDEAEEMMLGVASGAVESGEAVMIWLAERLSWVE